jgi:hypothetical protein
MNSAFDGRWSLETIEHHRLLLLAARDVNHSSATVKPIHDPARAAA